MKLEGLFHQRGQISLPSKGEETNLPLIGGEGWGEVALVLQGRTPPSSSPLRGGVAAADEPHKRLGRGKFPDLVNLFTRRELA